MLPYALLALFLAVLIGMLGFSGALGVAGEPVKLLSAVFILFALAAIVYSLRKPFLIVTKPLVRGSAEASAIGVLADAGSQSRSPGPAGERFSPAVGGRFS